MHLQILILSACVAIGSPERNQRGPRAKRGYYNGYYGKIYQLVDNTPAAAQFYSPTYSSSVQRYQEPKVTSQSQLNYPPRTQQGAYTQYTQAPKQVASTSTSSTQAQTVVTPIQHSTVVHHTPYVPNLASQYNPYLGRYVYLNEKVPYPQIPQIQTQSLHQQPLHHHLHQQQHPLQKQLHYQLEQVAPQKFHPSPQYYPDTNIHNSPQQQFLPIKNPVYNAPVEENAPVSDSPKQEEESQEEEEEEEKGELNEGEDEDEEEEDVGRYQEEEDDEEEDENPKYTNYSFSSNSKKKKNEDDGDEEDEGDHRAGYRTHGDVEEDDEEEDSDEGSTRFAYKKKTPKNFTKFDKKPPFTKSRPIKSQDERYTYTRGKNGKPNGDTIQGRPSRNVPVTVQKVYKEKWYVTRKA